MGILHIILLLALNSCVNAHKMGNHARDLVQYIGQYAQTPGVHQVFTTLKGHLVSFSESDGHRVAMVHEKLPLGFSHEVQLPVYFEPRFSLATLAACSTEQQSRLIDIMPTSNGRIIYVGRMGLLGGGQTYSTEKKEKYKYCEKGLPGLRRGSYECFQCGHVYKAAITLVREHFNTHFCNNEGCDNCLVKHKSICLDCTQKNHCNECCKHEDGYYDKVTRKMSYALSFYRKT